MALPFESKFTQPQLKRWYQAMPRRFSCRNFAAPATAEQMNALEYTAASVSLKGIRIHLVKSGAAEIVVPLPLFPRFFGLKQIALIFAKEDAEMAGLRAGMSGQAFQLELAGMGLQGCWLTGNYHRMGAMKHAKDGEKIMAVMPFGQPENADGAQNSRRKILTAFSPDDPTLWPYWAYRAAEAMRCAPSAMNRQPWKVSYTGQTLSFKGNKLDSIDTGIALMHLECALAEGKREWRLAADKKTLLARYEDNDEPV